MRRQVHLIQRGPSTTSLRALLRAVGEPDGREWKLEPFHANHAASRVELLALLSLHPQAPLGRVSWKSLFTSGARVAQEVFARPNLTEPERALGRTAANRVLLDASHTHLAGELRRWSWPQDRIALESHLIDQETLAALASGHNTEFLKRRGARLRSLVSSLLTTRSGVGQPIILPVTDYFDPASEEG